MRFPRCVMLPLAAALLLILSCAGQLKQKILDEPYRTSEFSISLTVADIEIVDGRIAVDTRGIKAPKFTFKQKGDTVTPPLTAEHRKVIRDEIGLYVKGVGQEVRIKATLKEGVKQYTLGFFNAREYAKTAVTVELFDDTTQPYLFSTTGEADYDVKSTAADTTYLETLYQKALKTSVYKAFEGIKGFLEKRIKENTPAFESGG